MLNEVDLGHLRRAIALARSARDHGNHPFGALLESAEDQVLAEAENSVVTSRDCTGHDLLQQCMTKMPLKGAPSTPVPSLVRCARARSTGVVSARWSMGYLRTVCTG